MSPLLVCYSLWLGSYAFLSADAIEDGIYALNESGAGNRIKATDGKVVILAERLSDVRGRVSIRSMTNDNSEFQVEVRDVEQKDNRAHSRQFALVVDGVCMPCFGSGAEGGPFASYLWFRASGKEAVTKVATRLGVDAQLRKHPQHRLEVRWLPDQESYHVGEPVILTMEMRNVGKEAIAFKDGGWQRGTRNNQFRFLAYQGSGMGKAVPDTGDPRCFGGMSNFRTLAPGEKFTKTVKLDKWFRFAEPDTYRVKASFILVLGQVAGGNMFDPPIWEDSAIGECVIKVVR